MDKKVLVSLVKEEAKNLKKTATKKERNKLKYGDFHPSFPGSCIYGLLAGTCFLPRAHELINSCCSRIYHKKDWEALENSELNGPPDMNKLEERRGVYYSPIECFISFSENMRNGNNKTLLNYIKGKTKILRFKKF